MRIQAGQLVYIRGNCIDIWRFNCRTANYETIGHVAMGTRISVDAGLCNCASVWRSMRQSRKAVAADTTGTHSTARVGWEARSSRSLLPVIDLIICLPCSSQSCFAGKACQSVTSLAESCNAQHGTASGHLCWCWSFD